MAISAKNYIIRSALDEDIVLLTAGGSKSKGARITAGALTETDNRCYWKVTVVSSTYNRIQNIQAGDKTGNIMAASVGAGKAVTQNAYKITTGAWKAELSGNQMTVNGQSVNTYFLKCYANDNLYLTVPDNGGNLYLAAAFDDDTSNQEFYFEETTYYNGKLATPKTLRTNSNTTYVLHSGTTTFYPQWTSASSNPVYELRYRSRRYDMEGNLAEDWSDWTGWSKVIASAQLNNKKKFTGTMRSQTAVSTPADVDNTNYSRAEIQVQTRLTSAKNSAGYNHTSVTHGAAVSQVINQWCIPSFSITAAVYSPDGLALTYATDYTIAGSSVLISKILDTTTGVTLLENYEFTGQDYTGDLYLNCDELYGTPAANDTIKVTATITEENGIAKRTVTQTLTVAYDANWGMSLVPTYTLTSRLTVEAAVASQPTIQLYLERPLLDGGTRWVACDKFFDDGTTAKFEIVPAYGAAPNLMWVAVAANATWTSEIIAPSAAKVDSDCLSWYWINEQGERRAAILKYTAATLFQPEDDITPPANKFITTGREYPVFRYSKSVERSLDIKGVIVNGESDSYCTLADFESMATANHCIYRQPDGKWYQVAITGLSFERNMGYTEVSIKQEAETR